MADYPSMDEARRFLRYVTPGLVFATESALLLWLVDPESILDIIKALTAKDGLGVAVGAVFASGGLGFMFSVVHHASHWWLDRSPVDYRCCIHQLRRNGVIVLCRSDGENWKRPLSRAEAWVLASVLWDQRRATSSLLRKSDATVKALNDLIHSIGAARVAAIVSPMLVVLYVAEHTQPSLRSWDLARGALAGVMAISWIVVLWNSIDRVATFTQMTMAQTLTDALLKEQRETPPFAVPVEVRLTFPPEAKALHWRILDRWSRGPSTNS